MAFARILRAVKTLKPDYAVFEPKENINVLRINFNCEYKAIEQKNKSRASTADIPQPSLWHYNDLTFIRDQIEIAFSKRLKLLELQH